MGTAPQRPQSLQVPQLQPPGGVIVRRDRVGQALGMLSSYVLSRSALRSGGNYVRLNMKRKRSVRGPALRGRLLRKQVRWRQALPSSLPPFAT